MRCFVAAFVVALLVLDASAAIAKNSNSTREKTEAKDVCSSVADVYTQGLESTIERNGGQAKVGQEIITFRSLMGGDCTPYLQVSDDKLPKIDNIIGGDWGEDIPDTVSVVHVKGKDYVLVLKRKAPYLLVDPGKGALCKFSAVIKPEIVENNEPKLCAKYLKGEKLPAVNWKEGSDVPNEDNGDGQTYKKFDGAAEISFDQKNQKVQVGRFSIETRMGRFCDHSQYAALIEQGHVSVSLLNHSLLDAQKGARRDRRWDADKYARVQFIQFNNKTYIDTWEGRDDDDADDGINVPRLLLGLANGKFQTICRLDMDMTFFPVLVTDRP